MGGQFREYRRLLADSNRSSKLHSDCNNILTVTWPGRRTLTDPLSLLAQLCLCLITCQLLSAIDRVFYYICLAYGTDIIVALSFRYSAHSPAAEQPASKSAYLLISRAVSQPTS